MANRPVRNCCTILRDTDKISNSQRKNIKSVVTEISGSAQSRVKSHVLLTPPLQASGLVYCFLWTDISFGYAGVGGVLVPSVL